MGFEDGGDPRFVPLKEVPTIVVSASVQPLDRHQSQQAGCNDFLAKPIKLPKLIVLLGNMHAIEEMAKKLGSENEKYQLFAIELQKLAAALEANIDLAVG